MFYYYNSRLIDAHDRKEIYAAQNTFETHASADQQVFSACHFQQ